MSELTSDYTSSDGHLNGRVSEMSGRKRKAPAGHSKAASKRPARGSSTPMPTPGQTAETITTPGQIAEEVTKTVIEYLQKNGLVAKATNETDSVRITNVQ